MTTTVAPSQPVQHPSTEQSRSAESLSEQSLSEPTTVRLRPRYEGSNICTWIGFKHVNYLVEEAVLDHLRTSGATPRRLFEEHALCVDIVSIDTRILHAFHMDDEAVAQVHGVGPADSTELVLRVVITVDRGEGPCKAVTSTVRVALRRDERDGAGAPEPAALTRFVTPSVRRTDPAAPQPVAVTGDDILAQLTEGRNAYAWKWRIPYFYCHFTERMQMSGYLRQLEEVVDLFLADRGVSIHTLLAEQNWIPVVPHSSISMLAEAGMEEDLYTVFTVQDVFKGVTYTARMDCYVLRDGVLVPTATGSITHGYALIENRRDWSLVNFDERMLTALRGNG